MGRTIGISLDYLYYLNFHLMMEESTFQSHCKQYENGIVGCLNLKQLQLATRAKCNVDVGMEDLMDSSRGVFPRGL